MVNSGSVKRLKNQTNQF